MAMELRDIEYFAAVADHENLGRAAEALGITQPALSKSLRRLEASLGVNLVRRTPKGVELTAEGATLRSRFGDLQLSLQSVAREIREVSEGRVGQLRLGLGAALSEEFLSRALAKLLRSAPRTVLKVRVSDNDVMVPALLSGELDLIVNYGYSRNPEGLAYEPLYEDEFVVCAAATHHLADREQLTLNELADARWACSDHSLLSQQRVREAFRDAGLPPPQVAFECRSAALRLRAVINSDLLDFTPRSVVRQLPDGTVKILQVPQLAWRRPVGLIRRKESYLPPVARRFAEILKELAKESRPFLRPTD